MGYIYFRFSFNHVKQEVRPPALLNNPFVPLIFAHFHKLFSGKENKCAIECFLTDAAFLAFINFHRPPQKYEISHIVFMSLHDNMPIKGGTGMKAYRWMSLHFLVFL